MSLKSANLRSVSNHTIAWGAVLALLLTSHPAAAGGTGEWYAFVNGRVALNISHNGAPAYLTQPQTPALADYKPVPSPDGSQIAFFRAFDYGNGQVTTWKTKICVMNANGTGFRELTGGNYMDTNPMWTRDGSNKIIWTRMEAPSTGLEKSLGSVIPIVPTGMDIYWTSPDAEPGDEERISLPGLVPYEFVYSGLKDGRLLIRLEGINEYALMTPAPYADGIASYELISYPEENTLLHKMTISPSETKIAYMKVANAHPLTNVLPDAYSKAVIAYADFDAETLSISNEVEVTEYNEANVNWYPSWSPEEDKLIYACSGDCPEGLSKGQIFEYDLAAKTKTKISGNDNLVYLYPAIKGVVK